MTSNILKGCEGACRIITVVLLLIAIGLTAVNLKVDLIYTIPMVSLYSLILVSLCIWYLLLLLDAIQYSDRARKVDGYVHVILGVILTVAGSALFIFWLFFTRVIASAGYGGGGDPKGPSLEEYTDRRRGGVFWYFICFGTLSFLGASVTASVLGCMLLGRSSRRAAAVSAGAAGNGNPTMGQTYPRGQAYPTVQAYPTAQGYSTDQGYPGQFNN